MARRKGFDSKASKMQNDIFRDDEIVLYSSPGKAVQELPTVSSKNTLTRVFSPGFLIRRNFLMSLL